MLSREQTDFLLCGAYNAVLRAGARISDIYANCDDFFVSLKADNTPITIADSEAHNIIKAYLSSTRIPLLSEEGRDLFYEERRSWDLFWLVDPLDGTEEFIKRNGEFTVNVALVQDGCPLLGVIYVPISSTIYFSDPERGAFCKTDVKASADSDYSINEIFENVKKLPLHPKQTTPVRVTLSRSHETAAADNYIDQIHSQYGEPEIMEFGSSLKFCLVAEGSAEAYIRTTPTMEWDTAAGEAIAYAAGATVKSLDGELMAYNKENLENPPFVCAIV